MKSEAKMLIGILIFTVILIVGALALFSRPTKEYTRDQLYLASSHRTGNPEAPNFLVEFSDFQCPACKGFHPVVKELSQKYAQNLMVVYRHFPLDQHEFARLAAQATEAAANQGKFWEMADYLFDHQDELNESFIKSAGTAIGLDDTAYQADLVSSGAVSAVERDLADATSLGLNATPTFFLNGRKLTLNSFADLQTAVERELETQ